MTDDTNINLPARPRIAAGLPVLRRRRGEVQIGLDPRLAVVVGNLSDPVVAAALRLTGHRASDDIIDELDPADRPAMSALLRTLAARDLIEDAAVQPHPVTARLHGDAAASAVQHLVSPGQPDQPGRRNRLAIAIHGDGRLAVSIACQLAGAGVGWINVKAGGTVRPEDIGTGYLADDIGRPRHRAAHDAALRVDDSVRTAAFSPGRGPDLVLLTDALVPFPEQVLPLMHAGTPHLMVRVRDSMGIVGPLVVPGLTSCLRCADLQRSDRDECWPQVAAQLAGRLQLADLASTQAAAALATAQALAAAAWLRGDQEAPTTCETSVEIDLPAATLRHRGWPAHSACPCGAARRADADPSHCSKVAADTIEG